MLETHQIQSSLIKTFSLYAAEKWSRVENFQNHSEPTCDLKIRRASALGGSTPPPGTTPIPFVMNRLRCPTPKFFLFLGLSQFLGCAQFCAYPQLRCREYPVNGIGLWMYVALRHGYRTVPGDAGQHEYIATCIFTKASQSCVTKGVGHKSFHA